MNTDKLKNIANTIQIEISNEETTILNEQINDILEYVSVIDNCECGNEEELMFMIEDNNRLREDIPLPSIFLQDALINAPKKNENFIKVPKVIE
jgi:aspartyl-tRNA(Asn)/glutamyl-tRNA(Gln) amidotransferase subunit C